MSNWGIAIKNEDLKKVTSSNMFEELIANELERNIGD
jgi:hypothetical protein